MTNTQSEATRREVHVTKTMIDTGPGPKVPDWLNLDALYTEDELASVGRVESQLRSLAEEIIELMPQIQAVDALVDRFHDGPDDSCMWLARLVGIDVVRALTKLCSFLLATEDDPYSDELVCLAKTWGSASIEQAVRSRFPQFGWEVSA